MDKHIYSVISKIKTRSDAGLFKYGTTLERDDLTVIDWLIHAQEEAMDLANYIEVIIHTMTDKTTLEALSLLKGKMERNETITEDDRRVFLIAINKILANYLQSN
jgi:thiamine kinase-like enzyme